MTDYGLQTFMRMANLYGPQQTQIQDPYNTPTELPTRQLIGESEPPIDENLTAEVEQPTSTLEAFRQSVLNPPQREHMTYPKSTLNGLSAALQIAAEPSPLEKNRVYVNGQAYQKQRVYTDPKTGKKSYITDVHEPSFGSQVMRAMPAAISGTTDILNQPYEDAKADWEMRNKGLSSAATAEANMALAQQRAANAQAIPERLRQGQEKIDISRLTAEEKVRLSKLNTLTDKQKLDLLQTGRITIHELDAAAALQREQVRGEYGLSRQTVEGEQNINEINTRGRVEAGHIAQRGSINEALARTRAEEARKTKAAPGSYGAGAGEYPTQQRVALQRKAAQLVAQHPEWDEYISIDDEGFPTIEAPGRWSGPEYKALYDQMYEALWGEPRTSTAPTAQPARPVPSHAPSGSKTPPKPTARDLRTPPPTSPGVQPIIQHSPSTGQYRISYDGGKTWRAYNPTGK